MDLLHEFGYSSVLQIFNLIFFNTILFILMTEFLAPLNVVPEMLWDELYPHLLFLYGSPNPQDLGM